MVTYCSIVHVQVLIIVLCTIPQQAVVVNAFASPLTTSSSTAQLKSNGLSATCNALSGPRPFKETIIISNKKQKTKRSSNQEKTSTALSSAAAAASMTTLAQSVAPKLGLLTATLLYLAPAAAVRKAVREKNVCDLNPLPLALMTLVTVSWLAYGMAIRDPYVALSNLPGAWISLAYNIAILPVLQQEINPRQLRLMQTVLMTGAASVLSLWTLLRFGSVASTSTACTILGMFASALTVILFGSPLSTLGRVLQTKNAVSILGRLTVAQITNSLLWTLYGFTVQQVFVWGPNLVGLILGLVQLSLKMIYPSLDDTCAID